MMTYEEQELNRKDQLNEVGTEPPCPFCQKPRVKRSDYIRCHPCAVNWSQGENIMTDPRMERHTEFMRQVRKPGAQTADGISSGQQSK